jgi:DNA-binding LacI/PurR family transcriptional regulator
VRDVAKEAGVSPATVSRVLSQADYNVSASLRQKVIQTAEQLGMYAKGSALARESRKIEIGIIVPNLSNPYFWQIAMGAQSEAHLEGASVYLCNSMRSVEQEAICMQSLYEKGFAGVLLSPVSDDYGAIVALQKKGLIVVLLEQSAPGLSCGKVLFNYLKAAKMAMGHLTENGHAKIAFVSAPITHESRREAFSGYRLGLLESGLPFQEDCVIVAGFEINQNDDFYEYELGRASAEPFLNLRPMPTAAFCLNDMIALGFISGLHAAGVQVPSDVSVIGMDNIQAAVISSPTLTTVSQPSFEIGRLAYKLLIDAIGGKTNGDISITIEPSLIKRNSVGRCPKR